MSDLLIAHLLFYLNTVVDLLQMKIIYAQPNLSGK